MPGTNGCKVGSAQIDITPPLGTELAGYFHKRIAKEIKSRLYTRALVVESGGRTVVMVANDLCGMPVQVSVPVKEKIAASCGLPPEAVMLSATHTHTAPVLSSNPGSPLTPDPDYVAKLAEQMSDVVLKACRCLEESSIYYGRTEAEGFSINKLCRLKSGKEVYDLKPMKGGSDGRIGFAHSLDNSVQVFCVRDASHNVKAFAVNYACHPNSGPEIIWAEWPGDVAATISAVYGKDVPCLFLQGTAGDVDCMPGLPHEQIGRGIAGAAIMAAERAVEPMKSSPVDYRLRNVKFPRLVKTPESDRFIVELKKRNDLGYLEKGLVDTYDAWQPEPEDSTVPIQCLRIGETALVGLPGEIFTALGDEIKRYSPAANTMVVELSNSSRGYFPPIQQAGRGGYGQWPYKSRRFMPEAAVVMTDTAIEMLWEMWDCRP